MIQILIKIQSVSDIITNSSSEVFCTITSDYLKTIYKVLEKLFPNEDIELGPVLNFYEKGFWDDDSPSMITINIPYGIVGISEFLKAGLESILDNGFGKDNYKIIYN